MDILMIYTNIKPTEIGWYSDNGEDEINKLKLLNE